MASTLELQDPNAGGSPIAPAPAVTQPDTTPAAPVAQPQSRLASIVGAVAKVASTALQGVPDKGRPSFATGLGEGARAEQQQQNLQQQIKFRNFDDQVRLAELHNQDLKLQNDTQAQKDAHVEAELHMRSLANDLGVDYDTIANDGKTVMDHLKAQTAASGAASVPPGTHLSGDGSTVMIPKDNDQTREGQKSMYSMLGPAFGLPALPAGAQFVPPKLMNMLTNKIHGYGIDGKPINHQDLPGAVGALQAQRDAMAKQGAPDNVLKALDNTLGIYKANLDSLDAHEAGVKAKQKQAELDIQNNPANQDAAARGAAKTEQAKLNVTNAESNQEAAARGAGKKAEAEQNAKAEGELNAVAYDPNYKNPDGSLGANVVMNKADAAAKGLNHYKANPDQINSVVGGMNDVQNKLNQLAEVTTDKAKMSQVNGPLAASLIEKGLTIDMHGISVPFARINAALNSENAKNANQATRDYVTAMLAAHEAVTQLPRLQTFGKSNRMTEQQMEKAVALLPSPGDGPELSEQKMHSLQTMIDPLRKQIPHMPGAESIPSWLEKRQQQAQQQQAPQAVGRFNPNTKTIDYFTGKQ